MTKPIPIVGPHDRQFKLFFPKFKKSDDYYKTIKEKVFMSSIAFSLERTRLSSLEDFHVKRRRSPPLKQLFTALPIKRGRKTTSLDRFQFGKKTPYAVKNMHLHPYRELFIETIIDNNLTEDQWSSDRLYKSANRKSDQLSYASLGMSITHPKIDELVYDQGELLSSVLNANAGVVGNWNDRKKEEKNQDRFIEKLRDKLLAEERRAIRFDDIKKIHESFKTEMMDWKEKEKEKTMKSWEYSDLRHEIIKKHEKKVVKLREETDAKVSRVWNAMRMAWENGKSHLKILNGLITSLDPKMGERIVRWALSSSYFNRNARDLREFIEPSNDDDFNVMKLYYNTMIDEDGNVPYSPDDFLNHTASLISSGISNTVKSAPERRNHIKYYHSWGFP